jgi:hypothetical protein
MSELKPVITTMSSLINCYEECFKKFGWMFLFLDYERANPKKISIYLDSIEHLIVDILYKIETVQSVDKKEELTIMLDNSRILKEYAVKNFHDCFLHKPIRNHSAGKFPFI